jgi:NAD-dependent dihydropyrimidine dehydrogenase PreA subunit
MKRSHLLLAVAALVAIVLCHVLARSFTAQPTLYGGLPWYGWSALVCATAFVGIAWAWRETWRERRIVETGVVESQTKADTVIARISDDDRARLDPNGVDYPHPIIFPERCIGCYACVEACPHGVLAIVNGIAASVARDQCMEDTACEAECPVNPKACIVINTEKRIPKRKVRNAMNRFSQMFPAATSSATFPAHRSSKTPRTKARTSSLTSHRN